MFSGVFHRRSSRTDFALAQEVPPRNPDTCQPLAARWTSTLGTIGAALLALVAADLVSTGIIFAGMAAGDSFVALGLSGCAIAFLAAAALYVRWFVRRRHSVRRAARDGVLVEGTITAATRFTAVRFRVGERDEHALFSTGGAPLAVGTRQTILYSPEASACLAFRPDGRAVRARLARNVVGERHGGRATLTFVRGGHERFYVALVALPLLALSALAVRGTAPPSADTFACDRATDQCVHRSHYTFGTQEHTFTVSKMTHSEVRANDGELEWVARFNDGWTYYLGFSRGPGGKHWLREQAQALQTYIADPTQKTFDISYAGFADEANAPSGGALAATALFLCAILLLLVHGWRTTLVFEAGTLVVSRFPALWSPRRQVFTLDDGLHIESKRAGIWLLYARLPTVSVRVRSGDRILFSRRFVDSTGTAAAMDAIQSFESAARHTDGPPR